MTSRKVYSPEEIVEILHSIIEVKLDTSGEIEAKLAGDPLTNSLRSFSYGSFTRELLELIEDHIDRRLITRESL